MEASQNPKTEVPNFMRDDNITEECKNLISSLPLERDFLGRNLCNYNGCWCYFNTLQAILDVQKHFRPVETDVIVASYPKTGTTWFKALTFALVNRQKYRGNPESNPLLSQNPHTLVPFLELDLYSENRTPDLTKLDSPRLFSTHMPFHLLQESVQDSPCKIVYVCRNPKDTLVSSWHFRRRFLNTEMHETTFEALDSFCSGVNFYGPFWDHTLSYWKESLESPNRMLFMKYEDMKTEPHVQINRLADFLDCLFTEEEELSGFVDEILKLCSLRSLSNLEINKTGKALCNVDFKHLFRKGEVGDWMHHLTPDMAKKIDEITEIKLQGSGLKF